MLVEVRSCIPACGSGCRYPPTVAAPRSMPAQQSDHSPRHGRQSPVARLRGHFAPDVPGQGRGCREGEALRRTGSIVACSASR